MGELHVCKAQYPMYEACAKPTVHVPVTALCRRCHCPCVPAVDSEAWTPSLDSFRVSLCSLPRAHRFCGPERPLLPSLVFFPILNGITWLTSRTSLEASPVYLSSSPHHLLVFGDWCHRLEQPYDHLEPRSKLTFAL